MSNNTDVQINKLTSILKCLDFTMLPTHIGTQCSILEGKIEEYNKMKETVNIEDINLQDFGNQICNEVSELIDFLTEYIARE